MLKETFSRIYCKQVQHKAFKISTVDRKLRTSIILIMNFSFTNTYFQGQPFC